jgi:hypothetical protein
MPVIARSLLVVVGWAAIATAEPRRVLVVDSDEELVHAIETSLAPWKLQVIAQSDGFEPSLVASRAIQADAQFIVWREGAELVVYDRERDVTERRPAKPGSMDPVAAAGAALTVKTMMRLPDPAAETAPSGSTTITTVAPPITDESDSVRIAASLGIDTEAVLRGTFGVMYRPMSQLRIGGAFEIGAQDLERAGFKGTARDYGFLATASWTVRLDSFEVEPWVAAGVLIDIVDGQHALEMRHETAVVPTGRVGVALWWWHSTQLGLALTGSGSFALGTPTYTRDPSMPTKAVFYDMPTLGGTIALVAAWRR